MGFVAAVVCIVCLCVGAGANLVRIHPIAPTLRWVELSWWLFPLGLSVFTALAKRKEHPDPGRRAGAISDPPCVHALLVALPLPPPLLPL
jgi:hypothetical protein